MTQPICSFVQEYAHENILRLHMPGHKGKRMLGPEALDITEITGADVLYASEGIIRKSEETASALFGSVKTLFSAEGSSLCIRAMLYLAHLYAARRGRKPQILAGRNAHKVFLSAAALLDMEIGWIYPEKSESLLSGSFSLKRLEEMLEEEDFTALYLTSPDYLGNIADLAACAEICHRHGVLFLVDNAHGAYLKFLPDSRHPLDFGADLCCDSAHKTLPVLTGGAYLHFSCSCPPELMAAGEQAMRLFASTSPSYLILQSLDLCNTYLAETLPKEAPETAHRVAKLKQELMDEGWKIVGDEDWKLTLAPKSRGMTGKELAEHLEKQKIFCEFSDPDYLVMMFSPCHCKEDYERVRTALKRLPVRDAVPERPPCCEASKQVLSLRGAMLSPFETLPIHDCLGRILAMPSVSCPPAVPILVCGEVITEQAIELFDYYGIRQCDVVSI